MGWPCPPRHHWLMAQQRGGERREPNGWMTEETPRRILSLKGNWPELIPIRAFCHAKRMQLNEIQLHLGQRWAQHKPCCQGWQPMARPPRGVAARTAGEALDPPLLAPSLRSDAKPSLHCAVGTVSL